MIALDHMISQKTAWRVTLMIVDAIRATDFMGLAHSDTSRRNVLQKFVI